MAHILIQKLPDVFTIYFHREGVFYQLKNLRDNPLKVLVTLEQEVVTPPSVIPVSTPPDTAQRTPSSTRKCVNCGVCSVGSEGSLYAVVNVHCINVSGSPRYGP